MHSDIAYLVNALVKDGQFTSHPETLNRSDSFLFLGCAAEYGFAETNSLILSPKVLFGSNRHMNNLVKDILSPHFFLIELLKDLRIFALYFLLS